MKLYEVTVIGPDGGGPVVYEVEAQSGFEARDLVARTYPGCRIVHVKDTLFRSVA